MPKAIVFVLVAVSVVVGSYIIEANQEYWSIEADGVDPIMVEYYVADSYYECFGIHGWTPTTWEYETYYKHYWATGEVPEVGQWLCLHLSSGYGYEEVKAKKIEQLYHSYLPMVIRQ